MMSEWLQITSLVLNLVLGGTLIVTVATLRATVKRLRRPTPRWSA